MKVITFSIWFDPNWEPSFRKSWKRRGFWVAKPELKSAKGKAYQIQIMDYTIKILVLGRQDG